VRAAQFRADDFTGPEEKQKRAFQAQKQPSQSRRFSFRNCLILNSDLSRTDRSSESSLNTQTDASARNQLKMTIMRNKGEGKGKPIEGPAKDKAGD
jgi:hypothetical protein